MSAHSHRPVREIPASPTDHIPLGDVVRSELLHIGDVAPVVFSWDARAHNPICYLRGAPGDAGAAAASLRVATYRPHAGRLVGRRDPGADG